MTNDDAALSRARLMVSGGYRIPWTYAGEVARRLFRRGLLTEGGYLTPRGMAARARISETKKDRDNG